MASLFVVTQPGLEGVLATELRELGAVVTDETTGGVEVEGPDQLVATINRWSRLATRVLLRVGHATNPSSLTKDLLAPWRDARNPLRLEAGEVATPFMAQAQRAWGPFAAEGQAVYLRREGAGYLVSLDTSGDPLHLRGFRQETGAAPLRETLGAGVLALAGWRPTEPLWDIMCGSGTLLIEAAEQCSGLAPGRARTFAFEHAPAGKTLQPTALTKPAASTPLYGSDLNAGALGVARRNAKRAEVFEALRLERLDATQLPLRPGPGLVIANLPYGLRVGMRDELGRLYAGVGKALRKACRGWRYAFLLEAGAEALGLPIESVTRLKNGGLWVELVCGQVP
jgi:putative N6-adenine-specific DNA methylase